MELSIEDIFKLNQIIESKPRTIGRNESQKTTLRFIGETFGFKPIVICATGSIRNERESPDGWDVLCWIHWADATNSRVWTIDISSEVIETCKRVTRNHEKVNYIVSDSIKFLKEFPESIDVLYLDAYDLDGTVECYNHQLEEIKAAVDKLSPNAIVISDDNYKEDWTEGKGNYSIPWMLQNGFKLLAWENSQAILQKIN